MAIVADQHTSGSSEVVQLLLLVREVSRLTARGLAGQLELVGVMHEPIEESIGWPCGAEVLVPVLNGQLRGDEGHLTTAAGSTTGEPGFRMGSVRRCAARSRRFPRTFVRATGAVEWGSRCDAQD